MSCFTCEGRSSRRLAPVLVLMGSGVTLYFNQDRTDGGMDGRAINDYFPKATHELQGGLGSGPLQGEREREIHGSGKGRLASKRPTKRWRWKSERERERRLGEGSSSDMTSATQQSVYPTNEKRDAKEVQSEGAGRAAKETKLNLPLTES